MKKSDRELGMDRPITRRDILHGMGVLSAATLFPLSGCSEELNDAGVNAEATQPTYYPPSSTGLRGSHAGSYEVAHQLGREGRRDWGPVKDLNEELYDLVVVGGGISGLSAAHFYLKQYPDARILILDNHDDFGGHAKRNEFQVGDRTLVGYGGAQTLAEPSSYSSIVKTLLSDLGVKTHRFDSAYDQDFYRRNGLSAGIYFDRESWGVDKTIRYDFGYFEGYIPLVPSPLSVDQAVEEMPISDAAKEQLKYLLLLKEDQIPHIIIDQKWDYLSRISYRDFLNKDLGITEPEVFAVLQDLAPETGVGIESATALSAIGYGGLPGWLAAGLPEGEDDEPYIHHFPDGNASIARLLVRRMIPAVASGDTMEDIVTVKFDYSKLDQAESPVRIRLNSTVTQVIHDGDPETAARVAVSFVRGEQAYRVHGSKCVLACYHAIIPYLCPELPVSQKEAMAFQVKTPILYTNVVLRNWQAWKNLGIGGTVAPSSYHCNASLDFPVSMGAYESSANPDEPVIVHMERFPHRSNEGLTKQEQFKLGRHELMSTSFETIEREVRSQLSGTLKGGGFDPVNDILAITVNRWAHGYSYYYSPLYDTVYEDPEDERYQHMIARKPFGRIVIANSDAAASAMLEAAVEQAHRAVEELG
ncbi:MAG: FAD/NAD(P)-binding protein [Pseudomonadales bacterium]